MARPEDVDRLRQMTGETDSTDYADTVLDEMIDSLGSLEAAAERVWGEKMGRYADLVNFSEAGSSRSNSDLFKHAQEMQAYYKGLVPTPEGEAPPAGTYSTTRRIVRS